MLELFYGCLIGGILFAVITLIFGHLFHIAGPEAFDPVIIVGWITSFGGTGVLLTTYTSLATWTVVFLAVTVALFLSIMLFFFYVKPMKRSENSTAFSLQDLTGRIGEVSVSIPAEGYGEVVLKIGAGLTNQIAASFDREAVPTGTKVLVVEAKESTLYVSRYDELD
ncbi:protease [Tumebacillus lipolyticus]|uniref:Protease n=1 Tax=Tumebacillus lipolyticus TaxID=1280370 RepID=A0ABW4ZYI1_9BACL